MLEIKNLRRDYELKEDEEEEIGDMESEEESEEEGEEEDDEEIGDDSKEDY